MICSKIPIKLISCGQVLFALTLKLTLFTASYHKPLVSRLSLTFLLILVNLKYNMFCIRKLYFLRKFLSLEKSQKSGDSHGMPLLNTIYFFIKPVLRGIINCIFISQNITILNGLLLTLFYKFFCGISV